MKILTVAGTRPELIRLSVIIEKLDKLVVNNCIDHIFMYTNQNYDYNLSGKFIDEMQIRMPDYYVKSNSNTTIGSFLSNVIKEFESIIIEEKPDKVLILGDTNSGLLSIIAEKYSIPILHMEAGNRCYDKRVPEETNRKIIDSVATYNLPYTENSKDNLLREGFHKNYIFKTGNPIYEVLIANEDKIHNSNILNMLSLKEKNYVLVTAHRAENVDNFESLNNIITALNKISESYKVIFSVHPRTKAKIDKFDIDVGTNVIMSEPFGFFDFVKLEKNAKCVISDSGTVIEETSIFNVPSITIRESTERQELIECGSTILTGTDTDKIVTTFKLLTNRYYKWEPPKDYLKKDVSDTVINILLGK